ncbi:pentapeptide repeat-containing protein [Marinobacter sp. SS13-12]
MTVSGGVSTGCDLTSCNFSSCIRTGSNFAGCNLHSMLHLKL